MDTLLFGCGVVGIPLKDLKQKLCLQNGTHNGQVGYCNNVLALMFKVCKFSLYDSKNTTDLCDEEDEQPDLARCTSQLQRWHKTGLGDKICKDMIATWPTLQEHFA